jgi:four helix bundle protein
MIWKNGLLSSPSRVVLLSKDCRGLSAMSKMQSSSSVPPVRFGANYIEANEAIGKKDFLMKIKICRREAKESCYWLRLLDVGGELKQERQQLAAEARQLMNIFGAILHKSE